MSDTKQNTTASTTDPVYSGPTGMDQSVTTDNQPPKKEFNAGNCLPGK